MHRPSLAKHPRRVKTLPFVASVQHIHNVSLNSLVWWVWDVAPHVLSSKALLCCKQKTHYYFGWLHFHVWCQFEWFTCRTSTCTHWGLPLWHALLRASGNTALINELWPNSCVLLFCRQPCVRHWVLSSMSIVHKYTCFKTRVWFLLLFGVYTVTMYVLSHIYYVHNDCPVTTAKECLYRDFLSNSTTCLTPRVWTFMIYENSI